MSANSQISAAVVLILISLSVFVIFSSFRSRIQLPSFYLPTSSCAATLHDSSPQRPPPLKVFMYDLPRRFNFDMLGRAANVGIPTWPESTGLKRQHSVEYWLTVSLMAGNNESGLAENVMEAVRVLDGDEAEVYFVPFFSSLSFNTHGRMMTDPETEVDRQLQVELLGILRKSKYWQRSLGHDHVIPMQHPNAFRYLRAQVNASILIVADFARYSRNLSSLSKDIVAPYVHVVDSVNDYNDPEPFESRTTLLFFRGRTVRKDEGKVRKKLANILKGHDDVRFEESVASGEGIRISIEGMQTSKFCLHPAGDTPSSCRLFDAIVSHCVPVIISDHIELPFESELDYSQFSLFFSTLEALQPHHLISHLRNVTKYEWIQKWRALKEISHHFEFQYPPKKDDAVNMLWRQVRHKLPSATLAINRNRRLKIADWW